MRYPCRVSWSKQLYIAMPSPRSINLRIPADLLETIDATASASGMDRSNWIRLACSEKLQGVTQQTPPVSIDDIAVVDERARTVVKELIGRIQKLEAHCFGSQDPFS